MGIIFYYKTQRENRGRWNRFEVLFEVDEHAFYSVIMKSIDCPDRQCQSLPLKDGVIKRKKRRNCPRK